MNIVLASSLLVPLIASFAPVARAALVAQGAPPSATPPPAPAPIATDDESRPPRVRDGRSIVIYDVRDLLPSFRGSGERRAEPAGSPTLLVAASRDATADAAADAECRTLLHAYFTVVAAKLASKMEVAVKESGALVVRGNETEQARVEELLLALRTRRTPPLSIEAHAFEFEGALDEALLPYFPELGTGGVASAAAVPLDDAHVNRFLEGAALDRSTLPKVIVRPLERFEARSGDELSYVANFEQVAIEGVGTIIDPVIKTLFEGISFDGIAIGGGDDGGDDGSAAGGGAVPYALNFTFRSSVLKRPIATIASPLGAIQLPELLHAEVKATVAGFSDRWLLVGGIPTPGADAKAKRALYLFVRALPSGVTPAAGARR
ncbi:MAG: hypothetical protein JNL90_20945 [Planctomycetes bacterium]|nr:hypothetical protein [Planctomycetota bacterium]